MITRRPAWLPSRCIQLYSFGTTAVWMCLVLFPSTWCTSYSTIKMGSPFANLRLHWKLKCLFSVPSSARSTFLECIRLYRSVSLFR
jgi:hypothetical protein